MRVHCSFWRLASSAAAVFILSLVTSDAFALSCRHPSAEQALRGNDVIFSGDALSFAPPPTPSPPRADGKPVSVQMESLLIGRYRVRTVWKGGPLPEIVEVHHHMWSGDRIPADRMPLSQDRIVAAGIDQQGNLAQGICPNSPSDRDGAPSFLSLLQAYRAKADEKDRRTRVAPGDVSAWVEKAKFFEEYRDRRGAVAAYARAVELAPGNADTLVGLARSHYALERFDETTVAAAAALVLRPDHGEARRLRDHALIKSGRAGDVDFAKADFSGLRNYVGTRQIALDLSGLKLDNARFIAAELSGISLAGSSLKSADFSQVRFHTVNFAGADLTSARLEKAYQYKSDYKGARLQGALLDGANLFLSTMDGADLRHARAHGIMLERVSLSGAQFEGADLSEAKFTQALAAQVDFADADLSRADFKEADLKGANLSRARLDGATFAGARIDCRTRWPAGFNAVALGAISQEGDCAPGTMKPDYAGKTLQHLDLSNADLRGVSFVGASLAHVRFYNANLEGADFTNASVGAEFRGANLRGVSFLGARAQAARFTGMSGSAADITGAVFRGVRLDPRNFIAGDPRMTSADLASADFRGAVFACINAQSPLGFDPGRYHALLPRENCPQGYGTKPVLRGVDVRNADWYNVNLRGVDLTGADLRGANMTSADLTDAILDRANLTGARYDERTIWPAGHDPATLARERGLVFAKIVNVTSSQSFTTSPWGFRPEDVSRPPQLKGAAVPVPDLAGVELAGVNLLGAWLPGARLDRAALKNADLNGANLQKASLRNADLRGAIFERALLQGADLRDALYDAKTVWPAGFDPAAAGARRVN